MGFFQDVVAFWRHVCHEPNANTAELLKSTYGTTCNKLNKLKGLQGCHKGRGEDSWQFHGSIYHPWGHEPWYVTHMHKRARTQTRTVKHTRTARWHPKQSGWEQLSMTGHILHIANGWLSDDPHTHIHMSTNNLEGCVAKQCNNLCIKEFFFFKIELQLLINLAQMPNNLIRDYLNNKSTFFH